MEREAMFHKGDLVRFLPSTRTYTEVEMYFKGCVGEVTDDSDLPNVRMLTLPKKTRRNYFMNDIITADQRDLVQVGTAI